MRNLTLILAVLFCISCQSGESTSEIIGDWKIVNYSVGNEGIDAFGLVLMFKESNLSKIRITEEEVGFVDKKGNVIESFKSSIKNEQGSYFLNIKDERNTNIEIEVISKTQLKFKGDVYVFELEK